MKGVLKAMFSKYKRFFSYGAIVLALSTFIICRSYKEYVQAGENKEWAYVVKDGDCLHSIAEKFKIEFERTENVISRIRYRNNINEVIYPGQVLYVPKFKY